MTAEPLAMWHVDLALSECAQPHHVASCGSRMQASLAQMNALKDGRGCGTSCTSFAGRRVWPPTRDSQRSSIRRGTAPPGFGGTNRSLRPRILRPLAASRTTMASTRSEARASSEHGKPQAVLY